MTMHMTEFTSRRSKAIWMFQCHNRADKGGGASEETPGSDRSPSGAKRDGIELPEQLLERLTSLQDEWTLLSDQDNWAQGQRQLLSENCAKTLQKLARAAAQARKSVYYRARHELFPSDLSVIFGLRYDSPRYGSSKEWLFVSSDLIRGNEAAVAAGFGAMAYPNAQEVTALLTDAKLAVKQSEQADLDLTGLGSEMNELEDRVLILASDVAAFLRYAMHRLPSPKRRQIMRNFGFGFRDPDTGRTEDPIPQEDPAEVAAPEQPSKRGVEVMVPVPA